jgi:hypothetical protein
MSPAAAGTNPNAPCKTVSGSFAASDAVSAVWIW